MKEWGFDPTTITVPVSVWFANQDLMVPATHGEWLAKSLPTARKRLLRRRRARLVGRQPPRRTVRGDQDDVCVKRV